MTKFWGELANDLKQLETLAKQIHFLGNTPVGDLHVYVSNSPHLKDPDQGLDDSVMTVQFKSATIVTDVVTVILGTLQQTYNDYAAAFEHSWLSKAKDLAGGKK